MGFLSDFLKRGKNATSERFEVSHSFSNNDEWVDNSITDVPLEFDRDGCLTFPDGTILKTIDEEAYNNYEYSDIVASLGYKQGELYADYYSDDKSDLMFGFAPEETDLIAFSELFTDKLVLILRHDGIAMSIEELNQLKTKMKKNEHPVWGLRRHDLLLKIGSAIENQYNNPISRQFIERVFKRTCDNNVIEVDKFHFDFSNDVLCGCTYNGYDVMILASDPGLTYDEIEDYFKFANKTHRLDDTMKKMIHYQFYCASKIESDVMWSEISRKKFSYDEDAFCLNYIAMAAFYKQCDVEQDMFLLSTDGQYEIISKQTYNGVTTTKIRAYRETFTFTNGHTMPSTFASNLDTDILSSNFDSGHNKNGYVYVMINSSFNDMVKIGKTTKDPNERAKELSSATGVPTPFVVVFYKEFDNCDMAESQIHQFLADAGCRVNDNREFFRVPVKEAIEVVQLFYDKERILHPIGSSQEELSDEEILCLIGIWKSTRMRFDDIWYDVSKERFAEFGRTLIFNNDRTFEECSAGTEHKGTYKIIGRDIHTYLSDGKYIIYHINSVNSRFADMTLIILDNQIQIEFEK